MCVNLAGTTAALNPTQAAGMQLAGAGLKGIGGIADGWAKNAASKAQARAEREAGQQRASRIRERGQAALGEARASYAASGVKVSSGSALQTEYTLLRNVERDAGAAIVEADARASAIRAEGRSAMANAIGNAAAGMLEPYDTWKRTRRPDPMNDYFTRGKIGGLD